MGESRIDANLRIDGLIEVDGDLLIEGRVTGRVAATGHVTIAAGASCRSSIRCPRLTIVGELIGNAACNEAIDVAAGARVVGDLRAPDIQVGANAVVDGRVDMLAPEPASRQPTRHSIDSRGLGPVRPASPVPPLARSIPAPPRPSGRVRVAHRGDEQ